jgi:hypothetical protein
MIIYDYIINMNLDFYFATKVKIILFLIYLSQLKLKNLNEIYIYFCNQNNT